MITIVTLAQAASQVATTTAQGALSSADPNPLRDWIFSGTVIYFIQKWLKTRSTYAKFVGVFPGADKWAHRVIPLMGSIIATLGIHYTWTGTALAGGTLTVVLPPVQQMIAGLGHFGFDVTGIFGWQQVIYECRSVPQNYFPRETNNAQDQDHTRV